jgi:hypothetical protein
LVSFSGTQKQEERGDDQKGEGDVLEDFRPRLARPVRQVEGARHPAGVAERGTSLSNMQGTWIQRAGHQIKRSQGEGINKICIKKLVPEGARERKSSDESGKWGGVLA